MQHRACRARPVILYTCILKHDSHGMERQSRSQEVFASENPIQMSALFPVKAIDSRPDSSIRASAPRSVTLGRLLSCRDLVYEAAALGRILKDAPLGLWHAFKRLLEALGLVLVLDTQRSNVSDLSYQDQSDPVGESPAATFRPISASSSPSDGREPTHISPYDSGSLCVLSPMRIIFLRGSQPCNFLIRSTLYSCVPSVRLESRPGTLIHEASRRINCPCG